MALLIALALALTVSGCRRKTPPLSGEGVPIHPVGDAAPLRTLLAAGFGTCAKRTNGYWCWGEIGDGNRYPVPTRLPIEDALALTLGDHHFCLLKTDRSVACAGRNLDGELGDGTFVNRSDLRQVRGLGRVEAVVAGPFKTCAIVEGGQGGEAREVFCFGADESTHKRGLPVGRPEPMRVGNFSDARELALDWGLACVRRAEGSVWCWGNDDRGQLGRGAVSRSWTNPKRESVGDPVRVLHVADAVGIAAGGFSACVLTARGTAGCWGENGYGGLGDGTTSGRAEPGNVVGLVDVAQISRGGFGHACARRRDGTVWCWGYRIGSEPKARAVSVPTPAQVPSLDDAVEIASGHTHSCARRKSGSIVCWGDNSEGQLGDGARAPRETPQEVLGPE